MSRDMGRSYPLRYLEKSFILCLVVEEQIWPTVILVYLLLTCMALADVIAVEVFEPIICLPFCCKEMIIL